MYRSLINKKLSLKQCITPIQRIAWKQSTKGCGPWDYNSATDFYGWEADRVVAVTSGRSVMELITRARTHLAVILVEGMFADKTKKHLQQAGELGLVDIVEVAYAFQI